MKDKNARLTEDARAYIEKLFPCEKPCDSYGICEGCSERNIFEAGYNFGHRAGKIEQILIDIDIIDKMADEEYETGNNIKSEALDRAFLKILEQK